MLVIEPKTEIVVMPDADMALKIIELAGRTCYGSQFRMTKDSAPKFVRKILNKKHESVIEHVTASVIFTVDRGISHEIVRHRLAVYSQSSTRYCRCVDANGNSTLRFIHPMWWSEFDGCYEDWAGGMRDAEVRYLRLLGRGVAPERARLVLPHSTATELFMTANFRQWRHVFKMRTDVAAHPQMRQVMVPLLAEFKRRIPIVFDDIIPAEVERPIQPVDYDWALAA